MLGCLRAYAHGARLAVIVVGLTAGGVARAEPQSASAGSWLDDPLGSNWNQVAMDVPVASQLGTLNPRCGSAERWAETAEDQALVDAGWSLFAPYRAGWGLMVVDAASGYDGMCRPLAYQSFVFVDGQLAGTISPDPMNSRETGAGTVTRISADTVTARFLRYSPADPLCCPSRGAVVVDYHVSRTPAGPVLAPSSTFQEPDPAPPPGPGATP